MKQRVLRLFVIPILVFCLLFCGCDGGGSAAVGTEASGQSASPEENKDKSGRFETVISELVDRDDPDAEYISTIKTYEMLPTEETIDTYANFIYADGESLYAMIKPYPLKTLCCFDRDGKLVWSRSVPEHEEGAAMYAVALPNENMIVLYGYQNSRAEGFLALYDADGNLLSQTDVPDGGKLNINQFQAKIFTQEDGGYRIVMMLTTAMLVIDEELQVEAMIPMDGAMNYMTHRGGDIFWVGYGTYLFEVDIGAQTKKPVETNPYLSEDYVDGDLLFDGSGNPYYYNDIGIYALGEDGEQEVVLEWLNGGASFGRCCIIDRERIYSMQKLSLGMRYAYQILDCTHTEEFSKPRRVIEIGMLGTGYDQLLKESVSLFNAENEDYYIRLIDYDVYGDEVASVFEEQVFAGETPDILISLPYRLEKLALDKYTSKNLIVDLNPIYGDSLLGAVRYAMSEGERMWSLPVGMTISTYAAARSVSDGPLTLDAFYQMADKLSGHGGVAEVQPDNGMRLETDENGNTVIIMGLATPNNDFPFEGEVITSNHYTIQTIFENGLYEFVDFENKDASFDSEEFCHFIEYLKRVDEDYVHINAGSLTPSGECGYKTDTSYLRENLLQGKLQLLPVSFKNIGLYPALKRLYGDGEVPFVLCGYPSSEGCGAKINTKCLVTVMADSTVHGGCKAFLDFLLSDRVQTSDNMINTNLPVTLSGLSGAIDRYRYFYYIRNAGDRIEPVAISDVPLEDYTSGFSATYNIEIVITDEDKAAMMDFFENCHMRADSDPVITSIVEEELSFWNGGARTLEETAKIIQSRVWIYLNE